MHVNATFDDLNDGNTGKYAVILFPSVREYIELSPENRRRIRSYCKKFSVSIMLFSRKSDYILEREHIILNYQIFSIHSPFNFTFNKDSPMWKITKPENELMGFIGGNDWADLRPVPINSKSHASIVTPLAFVKTQSSHESHVVSFEDVNEIEGVRLIFIGGGLSFWANHLIFLDALFYVTRKAIGHDLQRNFVVEINDIFMGNEKTKLVEKDVTVNRYFCNTIFSNKVIFHYPWL